MEGEGDIPGVEEQTEDFLFDDELTEEDELAIAEAEKAILEGRVISHDAMMRWMRSWGTESELPPPFGMP